MKWEVTNPLEFPGWNDLLETHPGCSFFHTANWAKVLCEAYEYRPRYFISGHGRLETLIPFMDIQSRLTGRRGVSLPFTDYSDPIWGQDGDFQGVIPVIIGHAMESGWRYFEIRDTGRISDSIQEFSTYMGHTLDLSGGEESVNAGMRSSTKRNIKKASKEGVEITCFTTEGSIQEFYRLNCLTRKEHGLPPQPYHFFRKIYEHVISSGFGFVALACHEGVNIAGVVCFHFGGKAIYKFGASDKRYQHLRANNLVMWEAIRASIRQGCKSFCFGRTEPQNQGLLQFKSGWGARERTFRYYRYDLRAHAFVRGNSYGRGFYNKIFAAMPLPLSRFAGEIMYRHVG